MTPPSTIPGLLSVPRLTTLFASLFVAVGAGTNYVFSAYSPQLAARLNINHTQLNVIGLAANIGVYSSGPFWGKIVDSRGPRIPIFVAFFFLFWRLYRNPSFLQYGSSGWLDDIDWNAAFTGGVNATAKTFPDKARATTTGIVLSGFGLSAFFFSTIAHFLFPGDTSSFLLLLSCGTAFTTVIGFFFVRAIPLSAADMDHIVVTAGTAEAEATIFHHPDESHTPLLEESHAASNGDDLSVSSPRTHSHSRSRSRAKADIIEGPNIYGRALWVDPDFWLLFLTLSLLSGTGLMYINNVGSMSQALYAKDNAEYDEVEASKWQAAQVSTISIMNFAGRILIGLISDSIKNRFGLPRSYSLLIVSTLFFFSQLLAVQITRVEDLWKASVLVGLSYGTIFGLFPTVCIEFFGLSHFSENWGYLSLSPLAGGNLFSIAFGRNLDAHEPGETTTTRAVAAVAATLALTTGACFVAILLSALAAWRERRKLRLLAARVLLMSLLDSDPTDWAYVSEGGATIVFSYHGPPSQLFDRKVLRLRKCPVGSISPAIDNNDFNIIFHERCITRLLPQEHLPKLELLTLDSDATGWLETLSAQTEASRPPKRRLKDHIDVHNPRAVLATDLISGLGIAVEIKPKWGFLPSPIHLSDESRALKTRTCRFCMHSHLRTLEGEVVATEYCPLDLYSGEETRVRHALEVLWEAWISSEGAVNNLRLFVDGHKSEPAEKPTILQEKDRVVSSLLALLLESPVLRILSRLQRTLDALDIEGLASISDVSSPGPEPTLDEWDAFISAYTLSPSAFPDQTRYHHLAHLLSATFKDCSVVVRIPEGTVTVIDLDVKSIARLGQWEKLDQKIVGAYKSVPEGERKACVDGGN
ncbi:NmrA domain-containing protein [Mycena indigotica]|uniref:Inositol-pentakisphosphate 2-kinase n=1 Tax=Mycena indigotica TaxID=2126181 RepID=A0A8H6SC19_9AGAR|nr:NmrA domain-containing protein [Mycena indigotica]KAF7295572.1 NmrA domain-containing protein [Mycena indigotica]